MNKKMLKRNIGANVLLVPPACRLDHNGFELQPVDDDWWLLQDVDDDAGLTISEPRTDHRKTLPWDHFYKYTSDEPRRGIQRGFLTLHVQLFVQGVNIKTVLCARPGERVSPPEIIETVVANNFPTDSGMVRMLASQGFAVSWQRRHHLPSLAVSHGCELVVDRNAQGKPSTFCTTDGLVLVKRPMR